MRKSPTLTGGINEVDCTESLMNAYESEINIYEGMRYFLLLPLPTKLRQGNVFTPVCHSVHIPRADTPQADTSLGRHPPGRHPPGRHPPGQTHPWVATPTLVQCILDTVNKQVVHILLECILVFLNLGFIVHWALVLLILSNFSFLSVAHSFSRTFVLLLCNFSSKIALHVF